MFIPIALCLLAWFYFKYVRKGEDIDRFPGPPTLPILGNILDLGITKSKILNNLLRLSKQYGPVYRLWLGPKYACLVITGPKYIEKILVTKSVTNKGAFYKFSKDWLGESMAVAPGQKWRTGRKFIAPFFNSVNVDKFVPVFNANAEKLIEDLKKLDLNNPVEVENQIMSCALGNICQTVLSSKCDEHSKTQFWQNFRQLADILTGRVFSMFARFDMFFRLTRNYQIQKQCIEKGASIISNFISLRKEERKNDDGTDTPKLLLDFLLDRCESDDQFTTKHIYQEMNGLLSAGSETVTASLAFCIYELSRHPDVQRKVWQEVEDVLADDDLQADISLERLHKLNYLQCVLNEILRMYAPAPLIERTLTEDITLEGELRIPKGTAVFLFLLGTHRSESVYSDPDKFNPDRFLSGNRLDTNQCTFVSFSAGARNCLGQRYFMMESKIMVSKIVRNFEIIVVHEHKPMLECEVVLRSSNGLPVILKQRNRK